MLTDMVSSRNQKGRSKRGCVISPDYGSRGRAESPKAPSQGSALGNVGKNEVALKGQKLSISKLLPFQGDFFVFVLKPRALPWARCFCPFRAYWV